MSGKVRQRTSANAADSATQSVNEKILKECHSLYTEPENGMVKIAEGLGLSLLAPRKKITVLMIGNHSAGKSSFINWYVEEHVQRTGVAIETQGFSFITSGRKRESLTGNATLHLYPHFEPLRQIEGVTDYLTTEISTSKQKKFSLVTFVDTPGLVDGDMKYPFDVNKSILWLGDLADLIFVFFDPIGQALCKRTLNLVEELNHKHADRIRFYLSKADEAGHESDRQIVQELCKRPGLNRTGFDMPTIYVPNMNSREVDTIQTTLNSLEKDCDQIAEIVEDKLEKDSVTASLNLRAKFRGALFGFIGMLLPLILLATYLVSTKSEVVKVLGEDILATMSLYLGPLARAWQKVPAQYSQYVIIGIVGVALIMLLIAKFASSTKPTLSRKQKKSLLEVRDYVQNTVKSKKAKYIRIHLASSPHIYSKLTMLSFCH
ncbi:unnamed protein product [Mytilus edulis]|uniref:Dynamin N-terminal domain-containing protein n=1 Tax=Mytilus edulis TaxID=6550 RepID=A0A8S3SIR4_MYTED|nr:unnamed protein product [Mytilus edulis]